MTDAPLPSLARRTLIGAGGGLLALRLVPVAAATPAAMEEAVQRFLGGATAQPGRVTLDVPPLVENGNAVPLTVAVDSPMSDADHVRRIAVFAPRNPLPEVALFRLGPRAGRARVTTRIRLADSQRLLALAELSDGSVWSAAADSIVTLAACLES